jgi:hypothetical protein
LAVFRGDTEKIALVVPLTPHTEQNGKLYYVAGSHYFGPLPRGRIDYERYPELRIVGPDLQPGDVFVHDFLTWHYAVPAQCASDRVFIQVVYQPSTDPSSKRLVSGQVRNPFSCPDARTPMSRVDRSTWSSTIAQARAAWQVGQKDLAAKSCEGILVEADASRLGAYGLLGEMKLDEGRLEEARSNLDRMREEYAVFGKAIDDLAQTIARQENRASPTAADPASAKSPLA